MYFDPKIKMLEIDLEYKIHKKNKTVNLFKKFNIVDNKLIYN